MAGSLIQYLKDIASHSGRQLKTDIIGFRASVATDGVVTYSTPPTPGNIRRLLQGWDYFMTELRVGGTPATDIDDFDQLRFNLTRSGESENFFSNDVEVSGLITPSGGRPVPVRFDPGGRKMGGGRDLELTVTARASFTTLRVLVVDLVCLLVPEGFV
jgi:hypothetical protein